MNFYFPPHLREQVRCKCVAYILLFKRILQFFKEREGVHLNYKTLQLAGKRMCTQLFSLTNSDSLNILWPPAESMSANAAKTFSTIHRCTQRANCTHGSFTAFLAVETTYYGAYSGLRLKKFGHFVCGSHRHGSAHPDRTSFASTPSSKLFIKFLPTSASVP